MIHIVFQEADVAALQKSFELDESMQGDIVEIKDEYAVGPIKDIYSEEGMDARKQWWREILAGGDYHGLVDDGSSDDTKTLVLIWFKNLRMIRMKSSGSGQRRTNMM